MKVTSSSSSFTLNLNHFWQTPLLLLQQDASLVRAWRERSISNYEYVMALNTLAGRTYNDVTNNGAPIAGSVSYLSGAEPLAQLTAATDLQAEGNGNTALSIAVSRYTACDANHGTPSSASPLSGFSENVAQVTSIVVSNGAVVTVADDTVLEALPLPAWSKNTTCQVVPGPV